MSRTSGIGSSNRMSAVATADPGPDISIVAGNKPLVLFAAFQLLSIGLLADLVVRVKKPRDEADPTSL